MVDDESLKNTVFQWTVVLFRIQIAPSSIGVGLSSCILFGVDTFQPGLVISSPICHVPPYYEHLSLHLHDHDTEVLSIPRYPKSYT